MIAPLLLVTAVCLVPGALVGLALGLRREAWLGTAGGLSLGVVALSVVVASLLRLRWGLLPVVLTTLAVTLVVVLCRWLVRLVLVRTAPGGRLDRLREHPLDEVNDRIPRFPWALAVLAGGTGAVVGWVVLQGMGSLLAPHQVYDAAFHVNAVQRVAMTRSGSPATVASTTSLGDLPGGFYPPLFHDIAALAVIDGGVTPVVAANILALVTAGVVWPLSMSMLVVTVAPRRLLGWAAAAVAMVTVPAAPYLFLSFGVLWPNALGMAVVPAALSLVARALGRARSHDPSLTAPRAVAAGLLTAAGLYYAHPNTLFTVLALALPVLLAWLLRQASSLAYARGAGVAVVASLAAAVGIVVLVRLAWSLPQLASVRAYDWPAVMSTQQALGEVLSLGIGDAPPVWAVAVVVVAGVIVAAGHRTTSWLSVSFVLACYLYVLAAGNDDPISNDLTGFWYNDRWRVGSIALVIVPPLAAIGVVRIVDAVRDYASARLGLGATPTRWAGTVAAVLAIALLAYSMPRNDGLHDPEAIIARAYEPTEKINFILTPGQRELLVDLADRAPASVRVVGDPYAGGVYAGVLSGRQTVFPHFAGALSDDQKIVRDRFVDYQRDPQVCAAVRRLRIGLAVGNSQLYWNGTDKPAIYPGVRRLEGVDGLEVIGRAGTATTYRVTPCTVG